MANEKEKKPLRASEVIKNLGLFFSFFVLPIGTLFLIGLLVWTLNKSRLGGWF